MYLLIGPGKINNYLAGEYEHFLTGNHTYKIIKKKFYIKSKMKT